MQAWPEVLETTGEEDDVEIRNAVKVSGVIWTIYTSSLNIGRKYGANEFPTLRLDLRL
jgi:hypothetical protein